jgi:DNA polymerase
VARAQPEDTLATVEAEARRLGAEVVGEGNPHAAMMLVGEAPGQREVEQGHPFVGPAGVVLQRLLDRLAIPRAALWITNIVKLRPVRETSRRATNRPPRASEVDVFRPIVEREIALVRPKVIVCLGAVAASGLIHPDFRIQAERGRWFPGPVGAQLLATYHPSYLLRLTGPDYEQARDAMLADLSLAWGEANSGS